MRRACCVCHIPLDGRGAITTPSLVSHGLCDSCGLETYGPSLWPDRVGIARWTGAEFERARSLAHHGTRRTAKLLGIAPSTVRRSERRPRITKYVQRKLCDRPDIHAYYRGLIGAA